MVTRFAPGVSRSSIRSAPPPRILTFRRAETCWPPASRFHARSPLNWNWAGRSNLGSRGPYENLSVRLGVRASCPCVPASGSPRMLPVPPRTATSQTEGELNLKSVPTVSGIRILDEPRSGAVPFSSTRADSRKVPLRSGEKESHLPTVARLAGLSSTVTWSQARAEEKTGRLRHSCGRNTRSRCDATSTGGPSAGTETW